MADDPRRLYDAKDMAGAILYAKRLADGDAYPILVNPDGSLIVAITSGTISIDTAGLATSVGQTTHTTLLTEISSAVRGLLTVSSTVTNSVSTISIVGRTLTGSTGSLTATNGTISLTPSNKIKVYAFSLTTTSATEVTCIFHTGSVANGLELWRVTLMAPSGANSGANLATSPPNFLFASRSGTAVSLSLSSAVLVHYSISYFDEA